MSTDAGLHWPPTDGPTEVTLSAGLTAGGMVQPIIVEPDGSVRLSDATIEHVLTAAADEHGADEAEPAPRQP